MDQAPVHSATFSVFPSTNSPQLTKLYGGATYDEAYAVTGTYNNEVATVSYQGDGIDLMLFEGPETKQGEQK